MGWTCPPHFCQRSFLRLIQIRRVLFGMMGVGSVMVWSFTHPHHSLPYVKFKMTIFEFAVLGISGYQRGLCVLCKYQSFISFAISYYQTS